MERRRLWGRTEHLPAFSSDGTYQAQEPETQLGVSLEAWRPGKLERPPSSAHATRTRTRMRLFSSLLFSSLLFGDRVV